MRNIDLWQPSKYIVSGGHLVCTNDPKQVGIGSRLVADAVARFYWRYAREHCRGRLLDLGCGFVPLYECYNTYVTEAICVDWPGTFHANNFIDCYADLASPLPFKSECFETIVLSDVLEHLPEPLLAWNEMARVLAPGGKVMLNVPFYYWLHEEPHDYYRYTRFSLERFAAKSGFDVLVLESVGGVPEVLADIISKYAVFFSGLGTRLPIALSSILRHLVRSSIGKRMSARTADRFPLGYFMIAQKRHPGGG